MAKYKRRIKLIKPKLQNQLTLVFLGLSALGLVMQFILFQSTMGSLASSLPTDGGLLMNEMNATSLRVLAISMLAILPLTYVVGVLSTFRIAGPLHRIEMHLEAIEREGYTGPCRTRKGDKLEVLVERINGATASLARGSVTDQVQDDPQERNAA